MDKDLPGTTGELPAMQLTFLKKPTANNNGQGDETVGEARAARKPSTGAGHAGGERSLGRQLSSANLEDRK